VEAAWELLVADCQVLVAKSDVLVTGAGGSDVQGNRDGDGRREEEKPGCDVQTP
jgi:hypothetical protein